jgi:indolepyruvate decarboxylase
MKNMTVGQFLLDLLYYSYEVEHIYGVDGDAVIRIRNELEKFQRIANITCAHESTAAFSAESYGRMKTLGVLYVTYKAGMNNAFNAIDEGYLHDSALLVIGGEPSMEFRAENPCLHHHQLRYGKFDDQLNNLAEDLGEESVISITNSATAAEDIAIMVDKATRDRLPVYIGMPSDMWDKEISYDEKAIEKIHLSRNSTLMDPGESGLLWMLAKMEEAVSKMDHPIISVGHEVKEQGLLPATIDCAEQLDIPVVSRFNGYGAFPPDHSLFVGIYNGPASIPPQVREYTESADRIDIGVLETDLNLALQTHTVTLPPAAIIFNPREKFIKIGEQTPMFCNVNAQNWLLKSLSKILTPRVREPFLPFASWIQARDADWESARKRRTGEEAMRVSDIAPMLNVFLRNKDMPIIADVGDAMFIALGILPTLPSRITYASIFAAMGIFAGCIGLEHATGKRPLVLVGDGAFCMGETYSLALTGAKPILIILNNGGWSMMRQLRVGGGAIEKNADSLLWPRILDFRADSIVKTPAEFEDALEKAFRAKKAFIIDLHLDPYDKSESLQNFKDIKR